MCHSAQNKAGGSRSRHSLAAAHRREPREDVTAEGLHAGEIKGIAVPLEDHLPGDAPFEQRVGSGLGSQLDLIPADFLDRVGIHLGPPMMTNPDEAPRSSASGG